MQGRSKWLFPVLISLWMMSCSHLPGPWSRGAQQPATPTPPQASTQGVPKVDIPEREFNFGTMSEDGSYVHDFRILNKGSGVLEIKMVLGD